MSAKGFNVQLPDPCPHSSDGWCLECVYRLIEERNCAQFNFRITNQAYAAQDRLITALKGQLKETLLTVL